MILLQMVSVTVCKTTGCDTQWRCADHLRGVLPDPLTMETDIQNRLVFTGPNRS